MIFARLGVVPFAADDQNSDKNAKTVTGTALIVEKTKMFPLVRVIPKALGPTQAFTPVMTNK